MASSAALGTGSSTLTMSETNNIFTPSTPLSSIIKVSSSEQTSEAVIVGMNSPPVPKKLAEKIWKGEYVQLDKLLPSNLGAPELTLVDLLRKIKRGRIVPNESRLSNSGLYALMRTLAS